MIPRRHPERSEGSSGTTASTPRTGSFAPLRMTAAGAFVLFVLFVATGPCPNLATFLVYSAVDS
jgi:hypothetical protein